MKHIAKIGFIILPAALIVITGSCSKSSYDGGAYAEYGKSANSRMYRSDYYDEAEIQTEEDSAPALASENSAQDRKLTKRAYLRLRVEDQAEAEMQLSELMAKYKAWPESSESTDYSLSYLIRVPSPLYDTLLAELVKLGKVIRRTENTEDVTLRYYDLESRLATKRELLKTYQGYLVKAKNIEEIMTVENYISNLQREIDQTGAQFRGLAGQVDYAAINVDISLPPGAASQTKPSLGDKIGALFSSFGGVVSTTLVVLTGILIYGIPAILLIVFIYWLLFGRIGLIKKLFSLASGKKTKQ